MSQTVISKSRKAQGPLPNAKSINHEKSWSFVVSAACESVEASIGAWTPAEPVRLNVTPHERPCQGPVASVGHRRVWRNPHLKHHGWKTKSFSLYYNSFPVLLDWREKTLFMVDNRSRTALSSYSFLRKWFYVDEHSRLPIIIEDGSYRGQIMFQQGDDGVIPIFEDCKGPAGNLSAEKTLEMLAIYGSRFLLHFSLTEIVFLSGRQPRVLSTLHHNITLSAGKHLLMVYVYLVLFIVRWFRHLDQRKVNEFCSSSVCEGEI